MDEIDTHFDEVRIERQKALRLHYNGSLRRHQSIIAKAKDEDKKTRDRYFLLFFSIKRNLFPQSRWVAAWA